MLQHQIWSRVAKVTRRTKMARGLSSTICPLSVPSHIIYRAAPTICLRRHDTARAQDDYSSLQRVCCTNSLIRKSMNPTPGHIASSWEKFMKPFSAANKESHVRVRGFGLGRTRGRRRVPTAACARARAKSGPLRLSPTRASGLGLVAVPHVCQAVWNFVEVSELQRSGRACYPPNRTFVTATVAAGNIRSVCRFVCVYPRQRQLSEFPILT